MISGRQKTPAVAFERSRTLTLDMAKHATESLKQIRGESEFYKDKYREYSERYISFV